MQRNSPSQSGIFNPRALLAFALCSMGVFLAMLTFAATPSSGITGSSANSPRDSLLVDKQAGSLSSKARAARPSMPLGPSAGPGWSLVTSPNPSTTHDNVLTAVTCASAPDCWAVGYYNAGSVSTPLYQTLIEHWDGTSWSIVTSPNNGGHKFLNGVTCASASDCWAVGLYVLGGSGEYQTLIERWDGTSWTIVTSPNISPAQLNVLTGVRCASASQCWAVGYYNNGTVPQTLIEKWDGNSWSIVANSPNNGTGINILTGVTCASASECWAVGIYILSGSGVYQTLIEKWDGNSWSIVSSPNTSPTQDNILNGVTCASGSECFAVGYYDNGSGFDQTLIEKWDGSSWGSALVSSPNTSAAQNNTLNAVTCASRSECWAVGEYNNGTATNPVYQTLIEKWDGNSWGTAPVTSPNTSGTQNNIPFSANCASGSQCWAVGEYNNGTVNQTLIEVYSPTIPPLTSVVSRMTHGSITPPFDITLPLTGTLGVECRSSAFLGAGNYAMIFTFVNNVSNCGTTSTGSLSSGPGFNQCTVNLTGVPNQQYLTVTLNNVLDSQNNTGNVAATMGVLVGDVNASGVVTSGDTNLCKAQALKPVTNANFRNDINASGAITTGDANIIKQNALTQLPSPP